MAGITNADFLNTVIPFGFDVATLGGYNLDQPTINASKKILERGRKEFYFPKNIIHSHIKNEAIKIKEDNNVLVSVNLRSTTPQPIIDVSKIDEVDIVEINCHCRQPEFLEINCGQNMLLREDLEEFISDVCNNACSKVSVKIRANVEGIDDLKIAALVENAGADYLHVDAMKKGISDADYKLLHEVCNNVDIPVIGNNSVNSEERILKMLETGVSGFSIARALISKNLDFDISNF